jgi:hypothetical protein
MGSFDGEEANVMIEASLDAWMYGNYQKKKILSGVSLSEDCYKESWILGDLFEMSCRFKAAANFHSIKVTQNDQLKKCSS